MKVGGRVRAQGDSGSVRGSIFYPPPHNLTMCEGEMVQGNSAKMPVWSPHHSLTCTQVAEASELGSEKTGCVLLEPGCQSRSHKAGGNLRFNGPKSFKNTNRSSTFSTQIKTPIFFVWGQKCIISVVILLWIKNSGRQLYTCV